MAYYNWQERYRQAYERAARSEGPTIITSEEARQRAWDYLAKHCSEIELARLSALARRYAQAPETWR